jgi:hypothetical protein
MQTSSTTDPTKTTLDFAPIAPLNTQPLGKLTSLSHIRPTVLTGIDSLHAVPFQLQQLHSLMQIHKPQVGLPFSSTLN